jgi:plastocyanin
VAEGEKIKMRPRLSKAALFVAASALLAAPLAGCSAGSRAQAGDGRREAGDVQRPAGETPKTETPKAGASKTETPATKNVSSQSPGDSTQTAADAGGSARVTEARVIIENFAFSPASLSVAAGTKVTWVNRDTDPHTATDTDKRFNSGALDTGEEFSFVFRDKGDYEYYCTLHPHMKGRVTVR